LEKVSIIIVNWNGKRLLSECLNGVKEQTHKSFCTILVDNGSNDGSVDFVKHHYPDVKVIELRENLGFSKANNIALRGVETQYVALLNNDAVPDRRWLEMLIDSLEAFPNAGFAASKMLLYENPERIDRAGDAYTIAGVGLLRGRGETSGCYRQKEWIFGACAGAALYRCGMLQDIGLFDEDFFLVHEDVDLSFRAQLRGYKCLYVPEAVVYHKASKSIVHDSSASVYYGHRNLEWAYIQNMPGWLIVKTIIPHIIYDMGAFFYFTTSGNVLPFVKAKYHAAKGLKRALEKRRRIQDSRKVGDDYIWSLLQKESFLPRLTRRVKGETEWASAGT